MKLMWLESPRRMAPNARFGRMIADHSCAPFPVFNIRTPGRRMAHQATAHQRAARVLTIGPFQLLHLTSASETAAAVTSANSDHSENLSDARFGGFGVEMIIGA